MAVEEEGLRVFQSVKIKIGKRRGERESEREREKKSLPPVCVRASVDGSILTGQSRQGKAVRVGD